MANKIIIGESFYIFKEDEKQHNPRIIVLVGPTGVGKTTTIAKLAGIFGIKSNETPAIEVRMITIDTFRVGAKEQLELIGDIMQIPVSCVEDKQSLKKEIAIHKEDTDLILIDTIGQNPKDSVKLDEMKKILDGAGSGAEFHLVISANTKTGDIENYLQAFSIFNYISVILTKIDETGTTSDIVSILADKGIPVSYITNGRLIPDDIEKADEKHFL